MPTLGKSFSCEVTGNNAFELPQAGSQSLIVKHLERFAAAGECRGLWARSAWQQSVPWQAS
ncbi:rCG30496 [Rattus norvegicus]|uniref:RCG30496 n=1 Tax=Rattus norvegicus TaxID=10116 RepID=A6JFD4_RAT|nr:rCG30496 [Rattus norvegicus]